MLCITTFQVTLTNKESHTVLIGYDNETHFPDLEVTELVRECMSTGGYLPAGVGVVKLEVVEAGIQLPFLVAVGTWNKSKPSSKDKAKQDPPTTLHLKVTTGKS